MSTTKAIAHNTIAQIVGKIISTGLGLLAIGMMTRYLGTEQFGWYITAISFLQFVGIITDFGLIPVTAQMLSEPNIDKVQLIKNLLGFRLATAIVCFCIAPVIALFFPYPIEVKIAIAISALSFLSVALNQILIGYYQTELRMHVHALADVIGRAVLVVGLWSLVTAQAPFLWVIGAVVFSTIAQLSVDWVMAMRRIPLGFAWDTATWKKIIQKMWPVAIAIVFNVVYLKGDIVLLSLYRSQTEVGLYGAAYRVLDIVSQMAMMVMGVIMPLLTFSWTRNRKEEFDGRYQQAFDILMAFAIPMTVGISLLAKKIMILVAGEGFSEAGVPLVLLSFAVFGVYLGAIFGHTAVAIDKQKQTIWIYASDAVVTLIGYLFFIPRLGMVGAAGMTIFSELYAGLFLFLVVRRYSRAHLHLKTLGKILVASATMGGTLLIFSSLHVIILTIIGIIVYGTVLYAIRGVSKETLHEVFSPKSV